MLRLRAERTTDVRRLFEGASATATIVGEEKRRGVYNFFLGNDRRRWQSNVPSFGSVRYRGLYDDVDVRVLVLEPILHDELHGATARLAGHQPK